MNQELSLRIAAPELYQKMTEIFATYHIHPYDTQGTVIKNNHGFEITLRFANHFSQSVTTNVSIDQAQNPDDFVTRFFEETAEKCKSQLVTDYFKMIKL